MSLLDHLRTSIAREALDGVRLLRGDWDVDDGSGRSEHALTPAAVLIPVIAREEPTVLLTRRTETLRKHAGQVAFPGGRIDPDDDGPIAAALREAHEEVALPPAQVEVIGAIDAYETGTGYRIVPVVGVVPPDLPLVPAEVEVAAVFEVPLNYLLDPDNHQVHKTEWQGRQRSYYVIEWETHRIWGVTAGIIVNLAKRLSYGVAA